MDIFWGHDVVNSAGAIGVGPRASDIPDVDTVQCTSNLTDCLTGNTGWIQGNDTFKAEARDINGDHYFTTIWSEQKAEGTIKNNKGNPDSRNVILEGTTLDNRFSARTGTAGGNTFNTSGTYAFRIATILSDGSPDTIDFQNKAWKEKYRFVAGINKTKLSEDVTISGGNNLPVIISNYTLPPSPVFNNNFNWYIETNGSEKDDRIEYVNMSIQYPNGTLMLNNVNGSSNYTSATGLYNFSSPAFKVDDGGTYLLTAIIR